MGASMVPAISIVWLLWLVETPSRPGCCFLWMDDGRRSSCADDVPTKEACQDLKLRGGWDRCHLIAVASGERCACEDPDGRAGGLMAVRYQPDRDDLDADGDRTETIRWRYVVSVGRAEVAEGRCREHHRLVSGWTDQTYS